jgi:putative component of membrane protein insertase Oxa1/YidC/SpoIIIJ protein YidD
MIFLPKKLIGYTLCLFFCSGSLWAQSFAQDLELIKNKPVSRIFGSEKSKLSLNPALLLLTFYQKVASPQLSANCVYEVSCSRHSRLMIAEFGLLKGIALTADRLSRCNHRTRKTALAVRKVNTIRGMKVIDKAEYYSIKKFREFEKAYLRR